jgi:carboxypeptidase PM20D1
MYINKPIRAAAGIFALSISYLSSSVFAADLTDHQQLARNIYAQAVALPTSVDNPGSTIKLAHAFAEHLQAAGFDKKDIQVLDIQGKGSLVVRYPGTDSSKKGIGFLAHMDVVTALKKDWVLDPFVLTEKDGFFMGRGTADNKSGAVGVLATFIKLKKQGYQPSRDLVIIFSGDEETGMATTKSLVKRAGELFDIEYAFNSDAGGGMLSADGNQALQYSIQAAEKTYHTLDLTVTNPGGHSSRPRKDNAIYQLVAALAKIESHQFPVIVNQVTAGFFSAMANKENPENAQALRAIVKDSSDQQAIAQLSDNVLYNATLRTTCVATMLNAGHAENALPQSAQATVNCRIMPGINPAQIEATLAKVIGDAGVAIKRRKDPTSADASPLRPDVIAAVKYALEKHYKGVAIVPSMSTGGTDGKEFRAVGIAVYGVGGLFGVVGESGAHGLNEKIRVSSFYRSLDHWERLIKHVSGGVN